MNFPRLSRVVSDIWRSVEISGKSLRFVGLWNEEVRTRSIFNLKRALLRAPLSENYTRIKRKTSNCSGVYLLCVHLTPKPSLACFRRKYLRVAMLCVVEVQRSQWEMQLDSVG